MSGFDLIHTYSSDALAQGILKSCFDLIHTYSSDALAQGILKSFFAFINFLMQLPRSEPVTPNRPRLSGKHGMHSPNSLTICIYVCMYVYVYVCVNVCVYVYSSSSSSSSSNTHLYHRKTWSKFHYSGTSFLRLGCNSCYTCR